MVIPKDSSPSELDVSRARAIVASLQGGEATSEEVFAAFAELDDLPSAAVVQAFDPWTGPAPDLERLDDALRLAHRLPARPLRLRTLAVVRDADLLDLGGVVEQQIRLVGKSWDGSDLSVEDRLDGELEGSLAGTLELHVLANLDDHPERPLFDVLLFGGDAGSVFRSGTTQSIASVSREIVEMRDRRIAAAIEDRLRNPPSVPPPPTVAFVPPVAVAPPPRMAALVDEEPMPVSAPLAPERRVSKPPVSEPPASEPPASEPPVSEPPASAEVPRTRRSGRPTTMPAKRATASKSAPPKTALGDARRGKKATAKKTATTTKKTATTAKKTAAAKPKAATAKKTTATAKKTTATAKKATATAKKATATAKKATATAKPKATANPKAATTKKSAAKKKATATAKPKAATAKKATATAKPKKAATAKKATATAKPKKAATAKKTTTTRADDD